MSTDDTRSARILLVEDEVIIAMATEARLKALGFEVVGCASDADEAVRLAEKERPDLAIMDINLGGTRDGTEAAGEIFSRFGVSSIFVTAYDDRETIARAASVGSLGYLVKPFEDQQLVAAVEVALYKAAKEKELEEVRRKLQKTVEELQEALDNLKVLRGLLPVCAWCREVRNDDGYWENVETYLARHTDVKLTHGICPTCAAREPWRPGNE